MESNDPIILSRDCEAVTVPSGEKVQLTQGSAAYITQSLGGNHTVVVEGNMYQINGGNADALGFEKAGVPAADGVEKPANREDFEKLIWEQMKTCYDPEIPVNVVDLGLIYSCELDAAGDPDNYRVEVKMTLTAPGCGMGEFIRQDVHDKISQIDGIREVNVELVWEPQWNQSMISEAAKLQLGLM